MNPRPNVLYLVHRVPYPPNRGDRIRSFHILKYLAERANVYLATLADEQVTPEILRTLRSYCEQLTVEPLGRARWLNAVASLACGKAATEGLFFNAPLHRAIRQWCEKVQFDAAVVFCSGMFQYVSGPALESVRLTADLVDVDSQKFYDYASAASFVKAWLYQLEAARLRSLEATIARRAETISLVSEAEAALFRDVCPNEKTIAIPNGVDLDYFQPRPGQGVANQVVFVGALDYPPNIDAMLWLCRSVWPQVKAALPDATLKIVGRNPDPAIQRLAAVVGVQVIGSVPDVRPHMASASVAIAPLRIARGIQNKVLEALAMRLPVVVSPGALEGLALQPGKQVLLARTAEQWIEAVLHLCRNRQAAQELGRAGRQFVESNHDWSSCLSPLAPALGMSRGALENSSLMADVA